MCRISVDTCTKTPSSMRRLFFDRLLLASNADGQQDGVGIADGIHLRKTHYPYLQISSNWISKLDDTRIWLGHLRAASRNTEISPYASHPFAFVLDDGRELIAMHNGFIRGMPVAEANEPKVDSYQAFKMLCVILNRTPGAELTPDIINEWTALFGDDSEWAFAFMLSDVATILRGNRPISYMEFSPSQYMFNTSPTVLLSVKDWIQMYWSRDYTIGRITPIEEFKMVTIRKDAAPIFASINRQRQSPTYDQLYLARTDNTESLVKL